MRRYTSFPQNDWAELLPVAEHAYNTATSESTKVSPFFANYGFNPQTQWVKPMAMDPTKMDWTNPAAEKLLQRWQGIWSFLQENILQAQKQMAKYYNLRYQKQPALKPGDMVMVSMKNMTSRRPSKKVDHRSFGPFELLEVVGKHAFKVQLPTLALNNPVFHVSELEPYHESTIEGRHQSPPPPVEIEGETNYVVESIGKSRENKRRKRVEYLVFWEDYLPEEATLEPGESLIGTAEETLQEFHKRYPK